MTKFVTVGPGLTDLSKYGEDNGAGGVMPPSALPGPGDAVYSYFESQFESGGFLQTGSWAGGIYLEGGATLIVDLFQDYYDTPFFLTDPGNPGVATLTTIAAGSTLSATTLQVFDIHVSGTLIATTVTNDTGSGSTINNVRQDNFPRTEVFVYPGGVATFDLSTASGFVGEIEGGMLTASSLNLGQNGILAISDGGTVTVLDDLGIGDLAADNAVVTITGSGSVLNYDGPSALVVGNAGNGALTVQSAATETFSGNVTVGSQPTGTGSVTVAGSNTALIIDGQLLLGDQGFGTLDITSGADVTINDDIVLAKSSGGVGTAIIANSASLTADQNITGSGTITVVSGGQITFDTLSDATVYLSAGGLASGNISGGIGTVDSGGSVGVLSGGSAIDMTIGTGGMLVIESGGVATGGTASATNTDFAGQLQVSSGGTANSANVNAGGVEFIFSGGLAQNTTVNYGGKVNVQSSGMTSGTSVNNGGGEEVLSGGYSEATTINAAGYERVDVGGTVSGTVISTGASQYISGAATDTLLEGYATIATNATLELAIGETGNGLINFGGEVAGKGGTLRIDGNVMPSNYIQNFRPGDFIDLPDVSFDSHWSYQYSRQFHVLIVTENSQDYQLILLPSVAGTEQFAVQDLGGGTRIVMTNAVISTAPDDFYGAGTSDILLANVSTGDTWFEATSNGAFAGWNQIGGYDTTYSVVGIGDFFGNGTDDILFRNNSTGDTWLETISNGAFAGWNQIGGSNTTYSIAGVADFYGTGTDDILFRNDSSGDTWFEAISNGAFAGWNQVGGSNTSYTVVGTGDFLDDGTVDILFRNNSTGDMWLEAISNGAFSGWNQIGGSDTQYSVVGVGDFSGNGTDDILFRNSSTGDTWFEAISNDGFAGGWTQVGGSDTNYAVVAVGDYFGNSSDDILFRNNSTGDTWIEAISNDAFAGWNQVGGSNASYTVKT
jgi:T5SS/PEP-CTERM-associated repeat protein/autotransporter passenger strand-loop-strand repeat protein